MNEEKIVKEVQSKMNSSLIMTTILSVVFVILLASGMILLSLFNQYLENLEDKVSPSFLDLFKSDSKLVIVLLYMMVLLLTIPFLVESITQTISTNKLSKTIDKIDRPTFIIILKNVYIFSAFSIAFPLGYMIAYFTLKIGNIWILIIPLILTIPFYVMALYLKYSAYLKAFKYLKYK